MRTFSGNHNKVSETDIPHLIKILSPFSGYWKDIGSQIGFNKHEIAAIEGDLDLLSQYGTNGYLSTLLYKWQPPFINGTPTLEALENALYSLGLKNAGESLRENLQKLKEGMCFLYVHDHANSYCYGL